MLAGDECEGCVEVPAQLVNRTGAARVVAGGLDVAAETALRFLEARHVFALPAMERDGDRGQLAQGGFYINAEGGVGFFGKVKGGRHECC